MSECWCCHHIDSDNVKKFHGFIIQYAHTMTVREMVSQFLQTYPGVDTLENIEQHVKVHFLHPSVHVANTLRSLLHLSEELNKVTVSNDTEDGSPLIDSRSVQLYLKVVNEIMGIYKNTDLKKMLYTENF